jgi:hypothetical protein
MSNLVSSKQPLMIHGIRNFIAKLKQSASANLL